MRSTRLHFAAVIPGGRPTMPHEATRKVLKYSPGPRRAWLPSAINRENLLPETLEKEWSNSRGRHGPGHINSGYSKLKEIQWEDNPSPITPVHELSKFMPDITIEENIHSTPVSLMHARNGHRVTHDLIHSYDPVISQLEKYPTKPRLIDHDKITPQDEMRFGLHPQTIGSRSRIFRYLRRAPFSDEKNYYNHYVQPFDAPPAEVALRNDIVEFANKDAIEEASNVYRKLTHPPTVEVYRAMMGCCERLGLLADAVALFDDGYRVNRKTVRDPLVIQSYLQTALNVHHPARVMRILAYVVGNRTDNLIYRSEVSDEWKHRLSLKALTYYLANNFSTEARSVYDWMSSNNLLNWDNYESMAQEVAALLADDKKSAVDFDLTDKPFRGNTKEHVGLLTSYHARYCYLHKAGGTWSVSWLEKQFSGIDVDFVLRLAANVVGGDGKSSDLIVQTAHNYLLQLHPKAQRSSNHALLPYLKKSKPSKNNPNIRTVPHTGELEVRRRLPYEEGYVFGFTNNTRFVVESYPALVSFDNVHKRLGRRAIQKEAPLQTWFSSVRSEEEAVKKQPDAPQAPSPPTAVPATPTTTGGSPYSTTTTTSSSEPVMPEYDE
eukprot:PhM_4_TR15031/c0_g1_i1/m.61485